ncbi:hypothetical protein [Rheinheimera baltica]|uniref:hypothetical protein n=1 Tax=Rheinheimera baltica TaxID=67576 RepID=UPI0012EC0BDA|nr:hypothetical protein [Rheinheimera baltica]
MSAMKGVVLIMALVFLLIMTLLVTAMLLVTQLSHKAAYSGQQQLQISQQALQQHLQQMQLPSDSNEDAIESMSTCPAQYAAWTSDTLRCDLQLLSTETYSDNRYFYAGYSSLVLQQNLALGSH